MITHCEQFAARGNGDTAHDVVGNVARFFVGDLTVRNGIELAVFAAQSVVAVVIEAARIEHAEVYSGGIYGHGTGSGVRHLNHLGNAVDDDRTVFVRFHFLSGAVFTAGPFRIIHAYGYAVKRGNGFFGIGVIAGIAEVVYGKAVRADVRTGDLLLFVISVFVQERLYRGLPYAFAVVAAGIICPSIGIQIGEELFAGGVAYAVVVGYGDDDVARFEVMGEVVHAGKVNAGELDDIRIYPITDIGARTGGVDDVAAVKAYQAVVIGADVTHPNTHNALGNHHNGEGTIAVGNPSIAGSVVAAVSAVPVEFHEHIVAAAGYGGGAGLSVDVISARINTAHQSREVYAVVIFTQQFIEGEVECAAVGNGQLGNFTGKRDDRLGVGDDGRAAVIHLVCVKTRTCGHGCGKRKLIGGRYGYDALVGIGSRSIVHVCGIDDQSNGIIAGVDGLHRFTLFIGIGEGVLSVKAVEHVVEYERCAVRLAVVHHACGNVDIRHLSKRACVKNPLFYHHGHVGEPCICKVVAGYGDHHVISAHVDGGSGHTVLLICDGYAQSAVVALVVNPIAIGEGDVVLSYGLFSVVEGGGVSYGAFHSLDVTDRGYGKVGLCHREGLGGNARYGEVTVVDRLGAVGYGSHSHGGGIITRILDRIAVIDGEGHHVAVGVGEVFHGVEFAAFIKRRAFIDELFGSVPGNGSYLVRSYRQRACRHDFYSVVGIVKILALHVKDVSVCVHRKSVKVDDIATYRYVVIDENGLLIVAVQTAARYAVGNVNFARAVLHGDVVQSDAEHTLGDFQIAGNHRFDFEVVRCLYGSGKCAVITAHIRARGLGRRSRPGVLRSNSRIFGFKLNFALEELRRSRRRYRFAVLHGKITHGDHQFERRNHDVAGGNFGKSVVIVA